VKFEKYVLSTKGMQHEQRTSIVSSLQVRISGLTDMGFRG